MLLRGEPPQSFKTSPSWSPDGRWIAYRSCGYHEDQILSTERLVSPDGTRHKVFYTGDDVMLRLIKRFIESSQEAEQPRQRELYRKEAAKLLREIRKRFPDTKRGDLIKELEKELDEP